MSAPNASILAVRFLYDPRTAGPMALGALDVPRGRFMPLNMAGAAVWAPGFTLLGYQFGNALQWLLDDLRAAEELRLGATVLAALAWRFGGAAGPTEATTPRLRHGIRRRGSAAHVNCAQKLTPAESPPVASSAVRVSICVGRRLAEMQRTVLRKARGAQMAFGP